jgi:hypothetical protein
MKVRFRFRQGRPVQRRRGKNRKLAAAAGALLIPIALMAYVLGLWRLASDVGLAAEFGITGLFSHWQIWIGLGLGLSAASSALNRYGRGGQLEESRIVTPFPHGGTDRQRSASAAQAASATQKVASPRASQK